MKKLRQKIKSLIREAYQGMENFETPIKDAYVVGLDQVLRCNKNIIDYKPELSVIWGIEIESKSWGIESIYPVVYSVRGSIEWRIEKEYAEEEDLQKLEDFKYTESSDYYEGVIEFNTLNEFNNKDWNIIDNDLEIGEHGSIAPNDLNINFNKMEIEIS
jgi:hypothetical protein